MDPVLLATVGPTGADLAWFWTTSISAALCAVLSLIVVAAGWRRRIPDVGLLGAGLLSLSLWSVTAGLLSPGPLFDDASAGAIAARLAFPVGLVAAAPLMFPRTRWSRAVARRWRPFAVGVTVSTFTGAAALLARPGTTVVLGPWLQMLLALLTAAGAAKLIARQWYLHRISRTRATASAAASILVLAVVALVNPYLGVASPLGWTAVAADNLAVFSAAAAMLIGYQQRGSLARVLAPVMSRDSLAGFEAGLAPEVRAFVAALEQKDPVTQNHVIRTSAMALRVAEQARLDPDTVRAVALGALLHDLGKLVIPSEILGKPSGLTDDEYATIKTHPEQGERILRNAPGLALVAKYVRGHHERPDGRGYPDGLRGDDVTLDLGIVSACDAWDAMTNTRQYRDGMDIDRATRILRDGAGTQWHSTAVGLLLTEVTTNGPVAPHAPLLDTADHASLDVLDTEVLAECACAQTPSDPPAPHQISVHLVRVRIVPTGTGDRHDRDRTLRTAADVIRQSIRDGDIVEHHDDHEIRVVVPGTSPEAASQLADRLHDHILRTLRATGVDNLVDVSVTSEECTQPDGSYRRVDATNAHDAAESSAP